MAEIPLVTRIEVAGVEESRYALAEYMALIKEFPKEAATIGYQMRKDYEATYQYRRGLSLLRTEWRNQHATLLEGVRAMRSLGNIGRDIVQMWQAYTVGMIRVERTQRDVQSATEDLSFWQSQYNQYVRDFGADSIYAKDAYQKMKIAADNLKNAQAAAKKAQDDMIVGWVGMGLQMIGTVANIVDIVYHLSVLKGMLAATGADAGIVGATTAASGGFVTLAATIKSIFTPAVLGAMGALSGVILFFSLIRDAGISVAENIKVQALQWAWGTESMDAFLKGAKDLGWSLEDLQSLYMEMLRWLYMSEAELKAQAIILGLSDEQLQSIIDHLKEVRMELGLTTDAVDMLGEHAYGGSVFPEMVKWSEKVAKSVVQVRKGFGSLDATIRTVSISNRFGDVTGQIDLERAGETVYKQLMKKLGSGGY